MRLMEKLYTLKEAKKLLEVTTRTIQRWDKDGKIRLLGRLADAGGYLKAKNVQ